ncbi:MAG: restriction endonuclease [Acidimicrobiaceae bacterium]|nr:restriction endonuclease [Acidimicrobiaceae bacterium]MXZ66758.1 restriction endonuclease [Acidimicrobiaceae bacterium]MYF32862.1 restriction endonuclease [Acidimicrobiaceae bacterium]MYG77848.1 restriction endonuclease [Acidimicrobiaceae bacterium]MYJ85121.1 restriction endonuclease [Acidimicrobiaceae bacterium]
MASPLLKWIREQTAGWAPSAVGVFQMSGRNESWPLHADSPAGLRKTLTDRGHLLPLPTEPAALANLLEIELRTHLEAAALRTDGAEMRIGTQRSFPDLEFSGPAFGNGVRAADIKCARRRKSGKALQSRIALYTGNTYFLWPQLKFSGILRPFSEYEELLSIVAVYDFRPDLPERITNLEVITHETWRIASHKRASATREYIGSVQDIGQLTAGDGEFENAEEFYRYWRSTARDWKKSPEAEKLLRRALEDSD